MRQDPSEERTNVRFLISSLCLAFLTVTAAECGTIVDGYLAPPNGTDINLSTPATNVSGQLITGWVYGDQIVSGHAGELIWADTVQVDNTSASAVTFELYLGMWSVGAGGLPGTVEQFGDTVPVTIGPGVSNIYVYTNWPVPTGDVWMGFAFTNVNSLSTTAAELNALHFVMSDGPTIGSSDAHALLSANVVGWVDNPAIGATLDGYLAQGTAFFETPEPGSIIMALTGLLLVASSVLWRRRATLRG